MNKKELIDAISAKIPTYHTKTAIENTLNALTQVITEQLAQSEPESVTLSGLGAFVVKERAERQGRNPKTGEAITIKAANVASFKVSKTLKDAIN